MKVELHIESAAEAIIVNRCLLELAKRRDDEYARERAERQRERELDREASRGLK